MKFGVQICQDGMSYARFKEVWKECERLGFDSAWAYDHLISVTTPEDYNLEGWTLISALAPQTKRIKFGLLVTCNNFRYPSVLAKMASTLDVISSGRFILGIGAGWNHKEYLQYGIPFPRTSKRIRQLDEALRIIKLMWQEEKASFKGRYYEIRDAINNPKSLQKPHPPILVGSIKGGRGIARIAASHADIYNTFALSPAEFGSKMDLLKDECKKLGRNPRAIEKTITSWPTIVRSNAELKEKLQLGAKKVRLSLKDYELRLQGQIFGTVDMCVDILKEYEKRELRGVYIGFSRAHSLEYLGMTAEVAHQMS